MDKPVKCPEAGCDTTFTALEKLLKHDTTRHSTLYSTKTSSLPAVGARAAAVAPKNPPPASTHKKVDLDGMAFTEGGKQRVANKAIPNIQGKQGRGFLA